MYPEEFCKIHRKTSVSESLFNKVFIKKETLAQVLSCEFCEISKNTFSCRIPPVAASERKLPQGKNKLNP